MSLDILRAMLDRILRTFNSLGLRIPMMPGESQAEAALRLAQSMEIADWLEDLVECLESLQRDDMQGFNRAVGRLLVNSATDRLGLRPVVKQLNRSGYGWYLSQLDQRENVAVWRLN